MNKNRFFWILLDLVFLVVFNVIFFISGGAKSEISGWVGYIFIHISYLMLLITPFLIKKSKNSAVLGFPFHLISSVYFAISFIIDIIFILINSSNHMPCLIVNIIILWIYAILLISNMIANEKTVKSIEDHEIELIYVKNCSLQLKGIMDNVADKQLYKKIENLYDLIHSSPVKSNNEAKAYEQIVSEQINNLSMNIAKNNLEAAAKTIAKIKQNAEERNLRIKYKS